MMAEPLFTVKDLSLSLGGLKPLRDVALEILPGEIHALLGEPGSGKSALARILAGGIPFRHGLLLLQRQVYRPSSYASALTMGVAFCGQSPELPSGLTLGDFLRLGQSSGAKQRLREGLLALGLDGLGTSVTRLTPAQARLAGVLRAVCAARTLVILDEPGRNLAPADLRRLHAYLRQAAARGISILYATGSAEEAFALADRFTILRDGQSLPAQPVRGVQSADELAALIPGCTPADLYPLHTHKMGATLLEAIGLQLPGVAAEVSFVLRRGEVLGLAGLPGAGRRRLGRLLCGLEPAASGILSVAGKHCKARQLTPIRAKRAGLLFLDAGSGLDSRAGTGLNLLLPALGCFGRCGWFSRSRAAEEARKLIAASPLAPETVEKRICELSAFERQMLLLLRARASGCDVLVLNEPGRGVDNAHKQELYRELYSLAASGKGVILISNYLPELQQVCDTIGVLHNGELCPPRPAGKWTTEEIKLYASSGKFGAFSLL